MLSHSLERFLSILILRDFLYLRKALLGAKPITDVAEVAHGARKVAFEDVAVQIFMFAAVNGLDEIREVSVFAAA